jgi:hypothetical protein
MCIYIYMCHVDGTLAQRPIHVGIRRLEVQLRSLLTSTPAAGGWSSLHSDRFNTKGNVLGSQRTGGRAGCTTRPNSSAITMSLVSAANLTLISRSSSVQPSHCTKWAIQAPLLPDLPVLLLVFVKWGVPSLLMWVSNTVAFFSTD